MSATVEVGCQVKSATVRQTEVAASSALLATDRSASTSRRRLADYDRTSGGSCGTASRSKTTSASVTASSASDR